MKKLPEVGALVRHVDTDIVGAVVKVYAAGEHPPASCEVVALSTGDELVWKPEAFEPLSAHEARVFRVLVETFVHVIASTAKMAASTGIAASSIAPLFRSALSTALRPPPR